MHDFEWFPSVDAVPAERAKMEYAKNNRLVMKPSVSM